jgi:N-acetyl-gamma-glutamyl-phosphate reductase
MGYVQKWQNHKFKIIDLSGDYRLSSADVYQKWYDKEHLTPDLVPDVVYGLPEIDSNAISSQKNCGKPGVLSDCIHFSTRAVVSKRNSRHKNPS